MLTYKRDDRPRDAKYAFPVPYLLVDTIIILQIISIISSNPQQLSFIFRSCDRLKLDYRQA